MVFKVFPSYIHINMLTQWKNWPKKLKNTNLILVRYSYKGGDNDPSIKYWGIFEDFHSCVTTVKMQPHGWFLVYILPDYCALTTKKYLGPKCFQNNQFTTHTYHHILDYGFFGLFNQKSNVNKLKIWIFLGCPILG